MEQRTSATVVAEVLYVDFEECDIGDHGVMTILGQGKGEVGGFLVLGSHAGDASIDTRPLCNVAWVRIVQGWRALTVNTDEIGVGD
jgi:hypothetical protein